MGNSIELTEECKKRLDKKQWLNEFNIVSKEGTARHRELFSIDVGELKLDELLQYFALTGRYPL